MTPRTSSPILKAKGSAGRERERNGDGDTSSGRERVGVATACPLSSHEKLEWRKAYVYSKTMRKRAN